MTGAKKELVANEANSMQVTVVSGKRKAQLALMPAFNAASVMEAYQGNILGRDVDFGGLTIGLRETFDKAKDGDLSQLERMLISQATALQTIFTNLAIRAKGQQHQKNFESFLSLALKAQSQSRATIQAVVELKYPRQVAFVKQANISHGPQQVNNGDVIDTTPRTRAKKNKSEKN